MTSLELVPWKGTHVPLLQAGAVKRSYSLDDYLQWRQESWQYGGNQYPTMASGFMTTQGGIPAEPIGNSFQGYVEGLLYSNGPVAAVEAKRVEVFSQAPMLFQSMVDGRPGDLYDDESLDLLREPWVGGTTSDLLGRGLTYADFGGNAYVVELDGEIVVLRPDYVDIVLEKRMHEGGQVGWIQRGILYREYGEGVGVPFMRGQYAHFAPRIDPLATYRGMSWLTPIIREVMADKSAIEHRLAYQNNASTPNLAVSVPQVMTPEQFQEFVDAMDSQHKGSRNAGKTLYTAGGADVTVVGSNMREMDFTALLGKSEPLALDTPIPTPTGWTTMGEIAVGDEVIGSNGEAARVLGVSPVHLGRDCYRVTLKDRTSIVADASHIWAAADRWSAAREMRTYTTLEMLTQMQERPGSVGGHKFAVPPSPAIELPEANLLVDPYVLGAWLGDGQTAGAAICGATEDLKFITHEIESRGYVTTSWNTAEDKVDVIGIPGGLLAALRALGVLGNKHIPQDYLRASVSQRLDLLRGLMDTDGCVDALGRGQCSFSSKFEHLTRQVTELLRSLGYRATVTSYADARSRTGSHWLVRFRVAPDRIPFLLPRKVDRCVMAGDQFYSNRRSIVSIEPVESVPVRCIAVDTEDHLFLAGEGFVPTHNTRIANAGGVPPVVVGFSEGLQGSSLNSGNYESAKRAFADTTCRHLWANWCGSLQVLFPAPEAGDRLWYEGRDIPFLHEDLKDLATIEQTQATTLSSLITGGFTPESSVAAIRAHDLSLLKHSGMMSVQLAPPGDGTGGAAPPVDPAAAEKQQFVDQYVDESAMRSYVDEGTRELFAVLDEISRAWNPAQVRNLSGPGRGRWRSMGAQVEDAADDPLKAFRRKQLHAAAKQRGLNPSAGMSTGRLKAMLLDDVRHQRRQPKRVPGPKLAARELLSGAPDTALADVYGGRYAGLDVEVTGTAVEKDRFVVHADVKDSTGESIGKLTRSVGVDNDGNLYADHGGIQLDEAFRGQGFASAYNGALEDWYRQSGVQRIETEAAAGPDQYGAVVWPRQGFDFRDGIPPEVYSHLALAAARERTRSTPQRPNRLDYSIVHVRHGDPDWYGIGTGFDGDLVLDRNDQVVEFGSSRNHAEDRLDTIVAGKQRPADTEALVQAEAVLARMKAGEPVSAYEVLEIGRPEDEQIGDTWLGYDALMESGGYHATKWL